MSKRQLLELAERVEGLSGPCRETDRLIALACFSYTESRHYPSGLVDDRGHVFFGFPAFTASLDDATTLVPEGNVMMAVIDGRAYAGTGTTRSTADVEASTLPLAIVASALHAKAAMIEDQ